MCAPVRVQVQNQLAAAASSGLFRPACALAIRNNSSYTVTVTGTVKY